MLPDRVVAAPASLGSLGFGSLGFPLANPHEERCDGIPAPASSAWECWDGRVGMLGWTDTALLETLVLPAPIPEGCRFQAQHHGITGEASGIAWEKPMESAGGTVSAWIQRDDSWRAYPKNIQGEKAPRRQAGKDVSGINPSKASGHNSHRAMNLIPVDPKAWIWLHSLL